MNIFILKRPVSTTTAPSDQQRRDKNSEGWKA